MKLKWSCQPDLGIIWRQERVFCQDPSISLQLWDQGHLFLAAHHLGIYSHFLEAAPRSFAHATSKFKASHRISLLHQILFTLWISLTSPAPSWRKLLLLNNSYNWFRSSQITSLVQYQLNGNLITSAKSLYHVMMGVILGCEDLGGHVLHPASQSKDKPGIKNR